jgi:xanthine dehydrogenase YagS FAD-binding subunit
MHELSFLHHTDLSILLQALMQGAGSFRPLAGGSDLVPLLKRGVIAPEAVLDISRVESLRLVHPFPNSGLLIGSLVTLAEMAAEPRLQGPYAALAEAAASAGPPQIRNVGTLGGNLLQRPRCPYFRAAVHCWLNGGEDCPARAGENMIHGVFEDGPCVATHPSDLATPLLALRAAVQTRSAWNERAWPLDQFLRPPMPEYRDETSLEPSELITHVQLPEPPARLRSVYVKQTAPGWSFALVAVALAAVVDGPRLSDVRLALGGVATVPRRVPAAERILSEGDLDAARLEAAVAASLEGTRPLAQNGYKLPLLAQAIRRAVERLTMPQA